MCVRLPSGAAASAIALVPVAKERLIRSVYVARCVSVSTVLRVQMAPGLWTLDCGALRHSNDGRAYPCHLVIYHWFFPPSPSSRTSFLDPFLFTPSLHRHACLFTDERETLPTLDACWRPILLQEHPRNPFHIVSHHCPLRPFSHTQPTPKRTGPTMDPMDLDTHPTPAPAYSPPLSTTLQPPQLTISNPTSASVTVACPGGTTVTVTPGPPVRPIEPGEAVTRVPIEWTGPQ